MRYSGIAIGLLLVLLSVGLVSCVKYHGTFSVANNASETITQVTVSICGQTIELSDIKPKESVSSSFEVTSDSHYVVRVEFRSGRTLVGEGGYVTNGMNFRHEISVTDNEVRVTGGGT